MTAGLWLLSSGPVGSHCVIPLNNQSILWKQQSVFCQVIFFSHSEINFVWHIQARENTLSRRSVTGLSHKLTFKTRETHCFVQSSESHMVGTGSQLFDLILKVNKAKPLTSTEILKKKSFFVLSARCGNTVLFAQVAEKRTTPNKKKPLYMLNVDVSLCWSLSKVNLEC